MHYVLADDSIPFDGSTAAHRPLGGAEKACAHLAGALVARGHTVTVLNRSPYPMVTDGVRYQPLDEFQHRPMEADIVIAFRQPSLLGAVRKAKHRLLWVVAAPAYLEAAANASLWESFKPTILFINALQQCAYHGPLPHRLLVPGISAPYFEAARQTATDLGHGDESTPVETLPSVQTRVPPHAVVTTHPLHGLAWLTEIWRRLVHPQMPEARMMVYSALLAKGLREDECAPAIQPVLDR
ncbi:MAG: glycosyltransferase family 1 protein, partial [Rhodospirillaceae bacterium]